MATPNPPCGSDTLYRHRLQTDRQEIRTLTLKPGAFDNAIHCVMTTASLIDRPIYTALSFVWGNLEEPLMVYVDEIEIEVTQNLAMALRYIRKPDQDLVLWVDALSINQNDVEERKSQVSLMGRLYSEAQEVIIWLGEADAITDEFACIFEETKLRWPPQRQGMDITRTEYAPYLKGALTLFDIVMLRPWWYRLWTVQECILPRNDPIYQCGKHSFPWAGFFDMYNVLLSKLQEAPEIKAPHDQRLQEMQRWANNIRRKRDEAAQLAGLADPKESLTAVKFLGDSRNSFQATSDVPLDRVVALCRGHQATVPHD